MKRVLKKHCEEWFKNPLVNPLTGRNIQEGKDVYNELREKCEKYRAEPKPVAARGRSKSKEPAKNRKPSAVPKKPSPKREISPIRQPSPGVRFNWEKTNKLMKDCIPSPPYVWIVKSKSDTGESYCRKMIDQEYPNVPQKPIIKEAEVQLDPKIIKNQIMELITVLLPAEMYKQNIALPKTVGEAIIADITKLANKLMKSVKVGDGTEINTIFDKEVPTDFLKVFKQGYDNKKETMINESFKNWLTLNKQIGNKLSQEGLDKLSGLLFYIILECVELTISAALYDEKPKKPSIKQYEKIKEIDSSLKKLLS